LGRTKRIGLQSQIRLILAHRCHDIADENNWSAKAALGGPEQRELEPNDQLAAADQAFEVRLRVIQYGIR
jgi:hypothetical protein